VTTSLRTTDKNIVCFTFPGGEPHIALVELAAAEVQEQDVVIDVRYSDGRDLLEMAVLNDFARRSKAKSVTLFIPYLPGARQDRDVPLTCKVIAGLINLCGFDKVVAVDPHSPVMPALIDNFVGVPLEDVFPEALLTGSSARRATLICPDAGAAKKVDALAAKWTQRGYQIAVAYGRKHRDISTGKLTGFACDAVDPDSPAIIVDDICDGGGTFLGLAAIINHPDIDLWTTHGIYSGGFENLEKNLGVIACTDSLNPARNPKAVVSLLTNAAVQTHLPYTYTGNN
jgi:ribose-phosphate pyrophosphokinase